MNIEFVSYNGEFPNLCSGTFVVKIDGEIVKFGHDCLSWVTTQDENGNWSGYYAGEENDPHYDSFWSSGGCCYFNDDYSESFVDSGEWVLDGWNALPEKYKSIQDELIEVFNENVPWGCCGGCI